MKEGYAKNIDFRRLTAPKLRLVASRQQRREYATISNCGTAALSLITGISPIEIQSHCPMEDKEGWCADQMERFLKKAGYTVKELTRRTVNNVWWTLRPITDDHVLLMVVRVNLDEYSAAVVHRGELWHNMYKERLNGLYFLNKPTETVLLVHHPSWSSKPKAERKPKAYLSS